MEAKLHVRARAQPVHLRTAEVLIPPYSCGGIAELAMHVIWEVAAEHREG